MELFNFLQYLSFSPIRSLIQNRVFELCDQQDDINSFIEQLNIEFPEQKYFFEKAFTVSANSNALFCHRIIYGQINYPKEFRALTDPPWTLTIQGSLAAFQRRKLSIVGSRDPMRESLDWMDTEIAIMPENGWSFLSGGARGIDQKAHQLCLRTKNPTIFFIPSGIEQIYPSSLLFWKPFIEESQSCIVSEFPDSYQMRKYSFSFRNRLIAAAGEALLVIEAGEKSGTLMTGNLGLEMGKTVFIIPGHPSQKNFRGSLELLRNGAQWIAGAEDLSVFLETSND